MDTRSSLGSSVWGNQEGTVSFHPMGGQSSVHQGGTNGVLAKEDEKEETHPEPQGHTQEWHEPGKPEPTGGGWGQPSVISTSAFLWSGLKKKKKKMQARTAGQLKVHQLLTGWRSSQFEHCSLLTMNKLTKKTLMI